MNLHELVPAPGSRRTKRRVGRGPGSGRVKTAGRGTKGQNSRSGGGVKLFFEGGQNPWTMKIPHKRGFTRGRFRVVTQVINIKDLEERFTAGDTVNLASLRERGLISDITGRKPVKLLGEGTLSKGLMIEVHRASASARQAIERAGGVLTLLGQSAVAEHTETSDRGDFTDEADTTQEPQ
jgi:large subunit ribosomal protein L15